jgi:predicted RNA-binding Zn-ribbon protein involved in translation (DUF1610 family)
VNCWKCKKQIELPSKKIGFRAVCPECGIDLHTCTNCRYYAPGKPNDCLVPGTDYIRDREAGNFCEEFKVRTDTPTPDKGNSKNKFNSLFKDEE